MQNPHSFACFCQQSKSAIAGEFSQSVFFHGVYLQSVPSKLYDFISFPSGPTGRFTTPILKMKSFDQATFFFFVFFFFDQATFFSVVFSFSLIRQPLKSSQATRNSSLWRDCLDARSTAKVFSTSSYHQI